MVLAEAELSREAVEIESWSMAGLGRGVVRWWGGGGCGGVRGTTTTTSAGVMVVIPPLQQPHGHTDTQILDSTNNYHSRITRDKTTVCRTCVFRTLCKIKYIVLAITDILQLVVESFLLFWTNVR